MHLPIALHFAAFGHCGHGLNTAPPFWYDMGALVAGFFIIPGMIGSLDPVVVGDGDLGRTDPDAQIPKRRGGQGRRTTCCAHRGLRARAVGDSACGAAGRHAFERQRPLEVGIAVARDVAALGAGRVQTREHLGRAAGVGLELEHRLARRCGGLVADHRALARLVHVARAEVADVRVDHREPVADHAALAGVDGELDLVRGLDRRILDPRPVDHVVVAVDDGRRGERRVVLERRAIETVVVQDGRGEVRHEQVRRGDGRVAAAMVVRAAVEVVLVAVPRRGSVQVQVALVVVDEPEVDLVVREPAVGLVAVAVDAILEVAAPPHIDVGRHEVAQLHARGEVARVHRGALDLDARHGQAERVGRGAADADRGVVRHAGADQAEAADRAVVRQIERQGRIDEVRARVDDEFRRGQRLCVGDRRLDASGAVGQASGIDAGEVEDADALAHLVLRRQRSRAGPALRERHVRGGHGHHGIAVLLGRNGRRIQHAAVLVQHSDAVVRVDVEPGRRAAARRVARERADRLRGGHQQRLVPVHGNRVALRVEVGRADEDETILQRLAVDVGEDRERGLDGKGGHGYSSSERSTSTFCVDMPLYAAPYAGAMARLTPAGAALL